MSAIYNLHKRQGQLSGFQDLIFNLKMLRFPKSLMLPGKSSYNFGLEKILFLSHISIFKTLVSNVFSKMNFF